MIPSFIKTHYFILIILLLTFYLVVEIFRSSFVIDGIRYFSLFDDMMIGMRYGYNFAHGYGLAWNKGEMVEGFSNPLWTLFMGWLHFLPIALAKQSLIVQVFNAGLLLFNLYLVKKIAERVSKNTTPVIFSAVLLSAFYYPIILWGIMGTEVTALMVLVTAVCYLLLLPNRNIVFFFLLLILATALRLDMLLPTAAIITYLFFDVKGEKRIQVIVGSIVLFLTIFTQYFLRYVYYHDILPNTYYLKVTGYPIFFRITRGAITAFQFLITLNWLVVFGLIVTIREQRNKLHLFFLLLFAVIFAYSIYVGGDTWEYFGGSNRFITPFMPLFFILVSYYGYKVLSVNSFKSQTVKFLRKYVVLLPFVYLFFLNFATSQMLFESLLIKQPQYIPANKYNTERGLLLDKITDPRATIAVYWAGATTYYSQRRYIDLLGKSDTVVAHRIGYTDPTMPFWKKLIAFFPGHMKWDYAYSIGQRKPDIIAESEMPADAEPYLKNYQRMKVADKIFFIRKDSPHVKLEGIKTTTVIPRDRLPHYQGN